MCEMKFTLEIGDDFPRLIVRSGSLGEVVVTISLKTPAEIDKLGQMLVIAKQQLEENRK